jgi:hypothetical protein
MPNFSKATMLILVVGALMCVASAEPVSGPVRAEVRPEARVVEARTTPIRCRIYFGCAPLARAGADADRLE